MVEIPPRIHSSGPRACLAQRTICEFMQSYGRLATYVFQALSELHFSFAKTDNYQRMQHRLIAL
jgi:hypothetical protein